VGWQPGSNSGTGEEPEPGPGLLGRGAPGSSPIDCDPRLPGFAKDTEWDTCPPSAALAVALEAASGPEGRCPGATRDQMVGLLRQWQALESWAAAGKLGVLRALIRDDDQPLPGGGYHGDLPDGWTRSLTHQVALALSMPAASADKLMWLAWDLQAALPGTAALLASGDLTLAKARAVDSALNLLGDQDAAKAEAIIVRELPGKTYGQVQKLAAQAAVTVDPEAATRRREDAERNKCRVQMFREETGAAGLSGRDMPTGQTLAAHASVCARAQEYKESGAFPDDTRMDQFRVAAYLDLLNDRPATTRIASGQLITDTQPADAADTAGASQRDATEPGEDESRAPGSRAHRQDCPCPECDGRCLHAEDDGLLLGEDDDDPGDGEPDDGFGASPDDGPDGGSPGGGSSGSPAGGNSAPHLPPRLTDLVLPLATLLGLAERPGEGHGLGPLDPALCRELASAATGSPWTRLCLTVTDPDGIAVGHGCGKRPGKPQLAAQSGAPDNTPRAFTPAPGDAPLAGSRARLALPARVNLTITATRLAELTFAAPCPPGPGSWDLTRTDNPGPPDGYGTWILTQPDGRAFVMDLEPVPTLACDHRRESHAYQPNDALRHLVQVRDYECTFPTCSRHARESDFEHATPYDKGGRTCGCNAGARSRACHQVKQTPGWHVTQPRPGWHQWETPTGRIYTQGPKRYLT
jgi:Domain of unknown function (DUF222)